MHLLHPLHNRWYVLLLKLHVPLKLFNNRHFWGTKKNVTTLVRAQKSTGSLFPAHLQKSLNTAASTTVNNHFDMWYFTGHLFNVQNGMETLLFFYLETWARVGFLPVLPVHHTLSWHWTSAYERKESRHPLKSKNSELWMGKNRIQRYESTPDGDTPIICSLIQSLPYRFHVKKDLVLY